MVLILVFYPYQAASQRTSPSPDSSASLLNSLESVYHPVPPQVTQEQTFAKIVQKNIANEQAIAAQAAEQAQATLAAQQAAEATTIVYSEPTEGYKAYIYDHESGNNPQAINPSSGACGLGQALPCSKMPCSLSDYSCQDSFFTQYMLERYGSWQNAYYFWIANSWW